MAESSVNPYLVTADHAMHSDAELRDSKSAFHTDGILPRSFKNHRSWWFGGKPKVDFPAFIKLSQIGWKQILYDPGTKKKIPHNWATGELRSPISAHSNNIWKITLEFLKTESIDNDMESVKKQKKAYNAQQMSTYDNEEIERELDGELNLQRVKQATKSLDNLTEYHKETRKHLDSRKGAQNRQEDFQIEEDALAEKDREERQALDAEIDALRVHNKQKATDKQFAQDQALAQQIQQEEENERIKKRRDAAAKRAVQADAFPVDEDSDSNTYDSEDNNSAPHTTQFSERTHAPPAHAPPHSPEDTAHATKLQNAIRNRLARKQLADLATARAEKKGATKLQALARGVQERKRQQLEKEGLATSSTVETQFRNPSEQQQAQTPPRNGMHASKREKLKSMLDTLHPPHPTAASPLASKPRQEHTLTLPPGFLEPLAPRQHPQSSQETSSQRVNVVRGQGRGWNPGIEPLQNNAERAAAQAAQEHQERLDKMGNGYYP